MAITDINKNVQGVGNNPGLVFRASNYVGADGVLVQDSRYLDNTAIRGTVAGQQLLDTGWLSTGTLAGIVFPTLFIWSDGTTNLDAVTLTIHRRKPGEASYQSTQLQVRYKDKITNVMGGFLNAQLRNRPSIQSTYFDMRYEYKLIISVQKITATYIDVEGLYMQFHQANQVIGPEQVSKTTDGTTVENIPVIDGTFWSATTDGVGNAQWYLYPTAFSADGATTGNVSGLFSSIEAANTSLAGGSSYADGVKGPSIITSVSPATTTILVTVSGYFANTNIYLYTMVYGYQSALVV